MKRSAPIKTKKRVRVTKEGDSAMVEKWPPLDPGTRVRTTKKNTPDREWMPEALTARKWGVAGTIIMHHDSHGLCYDVRHDNGTEGCYDPSEFEVVGKIMDLFIKVWKFEDAPKELQGLSTHGGDEDWVALIPPKLAGEWIGWMESGSSFGCCSVSEYKLPDGSMVRIGAHA